jgi:hypothetical protein
MSTAIIVAALATNAILAVLAMVGFISGGERDCAATWQPGTALVAAWWSALNWAAIGVAAAGIARKPKGDA